MIFVDNRVFRSQLVSVGLNLPDTLSVGNNVITLQPTFTIRDLQTNAVVYELALVAYAAAS